MHQQHKKDSCVFGINFLIMIFFKKVVLKFLLLTAFAFTSMKTSADESREIKIFIAKDILTLNLNNDSAEAVATQGSKILNVGSQEELTSMYPYATLISTYNKATIVPGFIEHHIHPFLAAVTMNSEILAIEDWYSVSYTHLTLPTKA